MSLFGEVGGARVVVAVVVVAVVFVGDCERGIVEVRDIERKCGEGEWGGEATGTYLMGCDANKRRNFLKTKDGTALVGEMAVILSDFVLWEVEVRWV